jgi:hypothetical protein
MERLLFRMLHEAETGKVLAMVTLFGGVAESI